MLVSCLEVALKLHPTEVPSFLPASAGTSLMPWRLSSSLCHILSNLDTTSVIFKNHKGYYLSGVVGWIGPPFGLPQNICLHPNLQNLWMWSDLGKRSLQIQLISGSQDDIILDLMWSCLNLTTGILIRKKQSMLTHREEGMWGGGRDWKAAAASQGMPRIAGSHQKARERHGRGSPSSWTSRWNQPYWQLDFELLTFRPIRAWSSVVLSHSIGGNLLQQPQEMNISGKNVQQNPGNKWIWWFAQGG